MIDGARGCTEYDASAKKNDTNATYKKQIVDIRFYHFAKNFGTLNFSYSNEYEKFKTPRGFQFPEELCKTNGIKCLCTADIT